MNRTSGYNLPLWESSDSVRRNDFNTAMSAIDAALRNNASSAAGAAKIAVGSYVGDGTFGVNNANSLTFDFEPKLLIITRPPTSYSQKSADLAVWMRGQPYGVMSPDRSSYNSGVTLSWNGNTVSWYAEGTNTNAYEQLNSDDTTYRYAAFG